MYLYFEPFSGFNDCLCSIIRLIDYCKKYNRILLINGMKSKYKINFSEYFNIINNNIICDTNNIIEIFNKNHTVYPSIFTNRLNDIINNKIIFYNSDIQKFNCDPLYKLPNKSIKETLIIYTGSLGGNGYILFKELHFNDNIKSECKKRYDMLKSPYISIQIRNTDRKSDYKNLYLDNKDIINSYNDIFISTDDKYSLDFFREHKLPFKNFTTFHNKKTDVPLHYDKTINPDTKFIDMICDIYIVSMSDKLLSNSRGGFIKLIRDCSNDKDNIAKQFSLS